MFDREWTSRMWDSVKKCDIITVPAPITGYVTPLAFEIHGLGWVIWVKSLESNVMWSIALESIIQTSPSCGVELRSTCPQLPWLCGGVGSFGNFNWERKDNWGSALATTARLVLSAIATSSRFFRAWKSFHQSGYLISFKQVFSGMFGAPTVSTFSTIRLGLRLRGWVCLSTRLESFRCHNNTRDMICTKNHYSLSDIFSSNMSISMFNCRKWL